MIRQAQAFRRGNESYKAGYSDESDPEEPGSWSISEELD